MHLEFAAYNPQRQDPKVPKVEDALHPSTKKTLDLGSLKLTEGFPSRPGHGTKGTKVELTANYVELLPPSNMVLHRYDIQISPEAAGRMCFRIVQLLLQSSEMAPRQGDLATDFRSTLVSKVKFPRDETIIEVCYRSEGEDEPAARATTYKIRVLYTKTLSIGELVNCLNSTNLSQSLRDKQELTQALNIFLNHYAKSANNLATIGSTKSFSLNRNAVRGDLGSGLLFELRVQTTHLPEKRNKANEVIPRVKTIFGLAKKDDGHRMAHPPRIRQHGAGAKDVEFWLDGEANSSRALKVAAKGGAKGKGKGNDKAQPESSQLLAPGGTSLFLTFSEQHPQLPLVNCGNRENPMHLPAGVCVVFAGQPSKSKLDGTQTQQMIRHAVRKPWENAVSIVGEGIQTVGLDENSNVLLRSFGLRITPGLIKVPGRVLVCPKVIYRPTGLLLRSVAARSFSTKMEMQPIGLMGHTLVLLFRSKK
ncbi:Piwi and PAZ domain protein [Metarhizium robertsii]|uniref:Piwi and PAZ domain protein n=1 Tax=Metarhizium robertsii TaxID=568076 RepID=A0A014N5T1_9HYPO|nr:Piwi and PAZ domain protein [Metarhizium robertsii]